MNQRAAWATTVAIAAGLSCGSSLPKGPGEVDRFDPSQPKLTATLWAATAVERRALAQQAFVLAQQQLDRALVDPTWRAAIEGSADASALPPAVVIDIDETALDNMPYFADQLRPKSRRRFDGWRGWIDRAEAAAIPGAVEFARYADERGVRLFFVSNRDSLVESATRTNLQRAGFALGDSAGGEAPDAVLLIGERPNWLTRDKASRRAWVAERHRVLLLIGDDFNDFVTAPETLAQRDALLARYADRFGRRWIVLPNAVSGSWERAAFDAGTDPAALEALLER